MQLQRSRSLRPFLALLLLMGVVLVLQDRLLALGEGEAAEKSPEPNKTAQGKAESLIRDLFKAEYKKAQSDRAAAGELAALLLKEGKQTNDDPPLRFVALSQARDLAAQAGDIALGLEAIAELSKYFSIDTVAMKGALLATAAEQLTSAEAALLLVNTALAWLEEAEKADNYKQTAAVVKAAQQAAQKVKEGKLRLVGLISKRAQELDASRKEFERLKPFVDRLEKDKDDAEANLEVGKYLCIIKGNFKRGLPLLVKGKDADLKALAAKDLANPKDAKKQVALGDAWDKLAQELKTLPRRHLERRVCYWYERALPELTGLNKVRVSRRYDELAKQFSVNLGKFTNSIGMKLVTIPAGKFLMGGPAGEQGRNNDEGPQHEVEISRPFYMGAYEVTQAQYEKIMGVNPSQFKPGNQGIMDTKDFPVEMVSWNSAKEFCTKLSNLPAEKSAGRVYRLPTEAEWEYACRAGSKTPFHFGNTLSLEQANCSASYGGVPQGMSLNRPAKVGSYKPNAWGLYDMHGNVWEWCEDWYDGTYYGRSPKKDPKGPDTGQAKIHHGGSYLSPGSQSRASSRISNQPNGAFCDAGFRVVCIIGGKGP
jgi:formylglycine-generating enzyme required for sulfatase activity